VQQTRGSDSYATGQQRVLRFLRAGFALFFLFCWLRPAGAEVAQSYDVEGHGQLPGLSAGSEVTLITYTPGEELYQSFGHSAIRIRDDLLGMDRLYNFGVFDFDTPNFYLKFAHGDLRYQLAVSEGEEEIQAVGASGGGVTELVLNLSTAQKQAVFESLEVNLLPENRFYQYDFVLDNCSTRPRDVIQKVTGSPIVLPGTGKETFRQMLDPYFTRIPWIGFGLSILLGAEIDRTATPDESCFLPANLERAFEVGTNGDQSLVSEKRILYTPESLPATFWFLSPVWMFSTAGILWGLFWSLRRKGQVRWPTALVLMVFGLVGIFVLGYSFWTRVWVTHENFSVLWLIPLHFPAGLWLWYDGSQPAILRWYLSFAVAAGVAFVAFSFLLPQQFYPAVYPLVIILVWRCAIELFQARKKPLS
jgi:hypothetical protein